MGKMTFDLNNVSGTAIMRLKPWNIYNVVFKGLELVKGTNKEGNAWEAIRIKFSGDEGIFEPLIFCPGEDGGERKRGNTNGKDWELPSALEVLQYTMAHLVQNLTPEMFDKFVKAVSGLELPSGFDKLYEILNKVVSKAVNKSTNLKLVGDNKGYATLPTFVSINKEGKAYISNNWLGENLALTVSEINKMESQKKAKPTNTEALEDKSNDADDDNSDLDFDV